jgi:serine/threonine protein kinase
MPPIFCRVTTGTTLVTNEIIELLGKGGLGDVYRARDTKLKRDVAIKLLPDEFSRDAGRLHRFQRDAEVLASLNHPNVATIYEVREADGVNTLLLACSNLQILSTSREALNTDGEVVWRVPSLSSSGHRYLPSPETLTQHETVAVASTLSIMSEDALAVCQKRGTAIMATPLRGSRTSRNGFS